MKFEHLYQRYIALWPERITISDGYPTGSGYMFPTLNSAFDKVELQLDQATDDWGMVVAWSMFQAFQEHAQAAAKSGANSFETKSVPAAAIDQHIRANLEDGGWENEKASYEGLEI